MYTTEEVGLVKTCGTCPEQYDAFIGSLQVGYLRLRFGKFTVEYPQCGDDMILMCGFNDEWKGVFDDDERDYYMKLAKTAIINYLNRGVEELKNILSDANIN
jgi:hypothetical protein